MRREFSKQVKREAIKRAGKQCEACGVFFGHKFHFDHVIPDALGGEPTLDNCAVLCHVCHNEKTAKRDVPAIAKTKRIQDRQRGIRQPRKITRWRKFNGQPVYAERER